MSDQDQDYLVQRRKICLAQAEASPDSGIAKVHRDFAAEYGRRLKAVQPRPLQPVSLG